MSLHIILLAAGSGSRFGGAKQSKPIDGVAMVRRAAQAAIATGAEVVVVTGAHVETVNAALEGLALTRVHNAAWESGMGSSIACGIRSLPPQSTAAIIALADQPLVGAAQLRKLIDNPRRSSDLIIAAEHGQTRGPPCLFPRRYYEELVQLGGAQGARKVLERNSASVVTVPMPEAAVDVDTREDYARLRPAIAGVILAGGAGARMGGADKGLLQLQGRAMVEHVLAAVTPQVDRILISANRNRERYAALGVEVVADPFPDLRGPLAGMLAALERIGADWLLAVPCDMPHLPADLAARLFAGAQSAGADAAYAMSGGDAHYTCCVLRRALAPKLRHALEAETRAVRAFLTEVHAVPVELTSVLQNINTPQALAAAERR